MKVAELQKIEQLLAPTATLLPIQKGSKRPTLKGWQKLRSSDTQTKDYQAKLKRASAIGVLLGGASGGIVTIDCDCPDFEKEMLRLNPRLDSTLRTAGARGCNFWLRMEGVYPPTKILRTSDGSAVGEWRSDKSQTIIMGQHPDGGLYRFLREAIPNVICFGDLVWPDSLPHIPSNSSLLSLPSPTSLHSTHSLPSLPSPALYDKGGGSLAARLKMENEAAQELKGDPKLDRLYGLFVKKAFSPKQGSRNSDVVRMMTFLFYSVARENALRLADLFYRQNASVFTDSLDQHRKEASAHLEAVEVTWRGSLNESELSMLTGLTDDYITGFRILRDLAGQENQGFRAGELCMSEDQFGLRLGIHARQAGRMLHGFEAQGVIQMVKKGERRMDLSKSGIKRPARATVWRWSFSEIPAKLEKTE